MLTQDDKIIELESELKYKNLELEQLKSEYWKLLNNKTDYKAEFEKNKEQLDYLLCHANRIDRNINGTVSVELCLDERYKLGSEIVNKMLKVMNGHYR